MTRAFTHLSIAAFLTILTQIGGIAWIASRFTRWPMATFLGLYTVLTLSMLWIAPLFGRVPLTCWAQGPLQMQSAFYCVLNRNYMRPELLALLQDTAARVEAAHPGTETLVLDASFPLIDGFPLLPHLSHDDGGQADIAFFYRNDTGFLPRRTRSPIGYFAFEDGPTHCPTVWPTLRWDMARLQPFWPDLELEPARNTALIRSLSNDARTGRIFVEPHLVQTLGVAHPNIGFQGCRAARHDDHIHVQL